LGHLAAVFGAISSLRAIATLVHPAAASSTILARVTCRCWAVGLRTIVFSHRRCDAPSNDLKRAASAATTSCHLPAPSLGPCWLRPNAWDLRIERQIRSHRRPAYRTRWLVHPP
jgi:hypothetical protein